MDGGGKEDRGKMAAWLVRVVCGQGCGRMTEAAEERRGEEVSEWDGME